VLGPCPPKLLVCPSSRAKSMVSKHWRNTQSTDSSQEWSLKHAEDRALQHILGHAVQLKRTCIVVRQSKVMYNMCGGNNKPHFVITSNKLPSLKVKQITTCGFVSGALFTILSSKSLGYGPRYLPPTRAVSLTCLYFPAAEHHRILAGAYSTSRRGRRLSWCRWTVTQHGGIATNGHPSQY